ncbi:UNVERIFIED_CONTAM: hypothetical protein K2H54_057074 [Gekko kuhli]
MSSSSSHEVSSMMPAQPPESPSPFWQLLALLADEPDLRWLDWVLCQRGATPGWARAETMAFLKEEEEGVPSSGGASRGHRCIVDDCPLCRSQAHLHLGLWPLEVLELFEGSAHPNIWRMYRRGLSRFLTFRKEAGLPSVWPVPVEQIRAFLVALDLQLLPSRQILGDLAGLLYIARMLRFPDPLQDFGISRMVMALDMRGDIQQRS